MTQRTQYTTPVDNAGVFAISNSDRFEGEELEPDWEWAKDHFARSVRQTILEQCEAAGLPMPTYQELATIVAAELQRRCEELGI